MICSNCIFLLHIFINIFLHLLIFTIFVVCLHLFPNFLLIAIYILLYSDLIFFQHIDKLITITNWRSFVFHVNKLSFNNWCFLINFDPVLLFRTHSLFYNNFIFIFWVPFQVILFHCLCITITIFLFSLIFRFDLLYLFYLFLFFVF